MTSTRSPAYQRARSPPVSTKIVEAVAGEAGVDPLDLDRPLADVIDTDALDVLYTDGESATTVEFTYFGFRVTVGRDGEVSVGAADG